MSLHSNPQLELAFDYVRNTQKNIFLTGRAGTGKTTFLHQLKNDLPKRMVVVASTGVAAINAGGMTIHSFFQLPFGPYLPGSTQNKASGFKVSTQKIRLIQSLDLLVIDEISMVRADLLDGIDEVLRRYRDRYKPFGGVQLLMIGDLHQLPPVVKEEEWRLLRDHYATPYFFGSQALRQTDPVTIELKHIYRQSDDTFIKLLNKVRDNRIDQEVLDTLNSRYIPDFQPSEEEPYITLTAHNASAREINAGRLAALEGQVQLFKAEITGDFPMSAFPIDEVFECKTGAQVMFVKNDPSPEKRYYNGKIGKVMKIEEGVIFVQCPGETMSIAVIQNEWKNVKYSLDEKSKEIKEETLGTFIHYPLKLAWAITIHKSQGLTFERAIIDAQAAFAHGQVYVALSRCKSFEGIVLHSKIGSSSVKTDVVVRNYAEEAERNPPDEAHLARAKTDFQQTLVRELFDFTKIKNTLELFRRGFLSHEHLLQPEMVARVLDLAGRIASEATEMADKFRPQMESYFRQEGFPEDNAELQARIQKASVYFEEKLGTTFLPALTQLSYLTDNKAVQKVLDDAVTDLRREIFVKNACFVAVRPAFLAQRYVQMRANAELDFQKLPPPASAKPEAQVQSPDIPHPILYKRLLKWRAELAATHEIEAYKVLPLKVLHQMLEELPVQMSALKKIKGVGKVKSDQFGEDLIRMIRQYVSEFSLQNVDLSVSPETEKKAPTDTKRISFELFQAGKSIEAIASERGLVPSTIEGHLAYYAGRGELDITRIIDKQKFTEIEQYFTGHPGATHSEARAYLGEVFSYGEIKMVFQYLKYRASESE
ncbi:MAG: helicase [Bacteroidetes bacterium]|nr:MAG: helicase [Bacteroidota bacterium]